MNEFFGTQFSQEDLQARLQLRRQNGSLRTMSMGPPARLNNGDTMDMSGMNGGGDLLDDIIMQNNKEIQRRQSVPNPHSAQEIDQRSSMMEFGNNSNNLNGYQFGQSTSTVGNSDLRRQSAGESDMVTGYADMSLGLNMQGQQMGFSPSMSTSKTLAIDTSAFQGMSPEMVQGIMGYGPVGMEGITDDPSNMSMFSPNHFSQGYQNSIEPMPAFMMPANSQGQMSSHRESIQEEPEEMMRSMSSMQAPENSAVSSPVNMTMPSTMVDYSSPVMADMPPPPTSHKTSYSVPAATPATTAPDIEVLHKAEPKSPIYKNIYSSSGFDMLGALMKVATRKNPEISIGKVDMSCAFVVCDITQSDIPIIYVSDIFERLTGYTKHEVLGRNCRFLQSPEGKVQAGVRREFVDDESVFYLKQRIAHKREAQRSLINYRKGGQPFMNLLTMIPISGEDDERIRYYVGFQVDLVEKPTSVEGKNASGLYTVDYSQGMLPQYIWQPPDGSRRMGSGQTISRDDVSTVLSTINSSTESELTKRMWDKVLLENTDDVVHVLSLKGLFLYLSPSSRKVLEYDASELVGTALSSVCHPSDIVPVTRELKDTSTGAAVNVVFRIRRKKSGYTWFESHGSLCVEQGKGRKCIILVGRERPVYALARHDIESAGGFGDSEMWTKLSTSGMFLFVSSNVRTLLDRSPDDLVGTSLQALMRSESRVEFGRSLEKARTGKRVTYKHEVLNKRGLVLQAETTLYPGDAAEGSKPTFLVAQTRLLKYSSRSALSSHGANAKSIGSIGKKDRHSADSPPFNHGSTLGALTQEGELTPRSSGSLPGPITQAGGAGLPIGSQDMALASEENIFDELKTTRCTSWQFELRQMEKSNRLLAEELGALLANKKKRKRRKGAGHLQRDCANCHTRVTPEWRRGPSGQRDLCNSCGLRWAKQTGRVSPRTSTRGADSGSKASQHSVSPGHRSPTTNEAQQKKQNLSNTPNLNLTSMRKANGKKKGKDTEVIGTSTAVSGSFGGRSSTESIPVYIPSQGFREGGERGVTNIDEESDNEGMS